MLAVPALPVVSGNPYAAFRKFPELAATPGTSYFRDRQALISKTLPVIVLTRHQLADTATGIKRIYEAEPPRKVNQDHNKKHRLGDVSVEIFCGSLYSVVTGFLAVSRGAFRINE